MNGYTFRQTHILILLFITVVINYMDRTNIAIAATALSEDLSINPTQMGLLFSAFAWTYTAFQVPGGILADRLNAKLLYPVLLIAWSLATLAQGFMNAFTFILVARVLIGVFEAPSYPINNKIVTAWFSENQRASAIAIYTSGQYVGLALLTPILFLIQKYYGWQGLFIISGLIGIVWAIIWFIAYRDPTHDKHHAPHLDVEPTVSKAEFRMADLIHAFSHTKLWGIYIGQFCLGTTTIFFLTWFPTYLTDYRGIELTKSGVLAAFPYAAAFLGILLSGFLSDYLDKKGYSKTISRKLPVLAGMLISTSTVGAMFTDNNYVIIALLSFAFFGNGMASIAWIFVSLIAPKNQVGLIGGVFNFAGGLSAIITPFVIGLIIQHADFSLALLYIASIAFIGVFVYLFMLGKVERIEAHDSTKIMKVEAAR